MPDDEYPPDAIRYLAYIAPTWRRPSGHVEDVLEVPPEPGDELPRAEDVSPSVGGRLTSPHNIMAAYARGEIAGLDAARALRLETLDALHDAMPDVGQHAMPPFAEHAHDGEDVVRVLRAAELLDDLRTPLLPVTSAAVEVALKRIMVDVGFTDEMIRTRFPGDELP